MQEPQGKQYARGDWQRPIVGLLATGAVLIVMSFVTYRSVDRLRDNDRVVAHTYAVLNELSQALGQARDAEAAQRGFLLTQSSEYTETIDLDSQNALRAADRLIELTADDPEQQARARQFAEELGARLDRLKQTIQVAREGSLKQARTMMVEGIGVRLMNAATTTAHTIEIEERRLLDLRSAQSDSNARLVLAVFAATGVLTLILLGLVARAVTREAQLQAARADELTRGERRYRTLVEQHPDAVLVIQNDRTVFVNSAMVRLFAAKDPSELLGRSRFALVHEDSLPLVRERDAKMAAENLQLLPVAEVKWVKMDGSAVYCESRPARILWDGADAMQIVITDITKRKAAEEQQRRFNDEMEQRVAQRTAELQEANAELQAFAHSVAHDLRAPLRNMQGFAVALLEDYGERLDATGKKYAERIVAGAKRLDDLIQDLLAYSRLTRSQIDLDRVELEPLVRRITQEMESELTARNAALEIESPLPAVIAHAPTLGQVVMNLISNAAKFSAPGVRPKVHVRHSDSNGLVRLLVRDNGIGIEPRHQERIFRVFERLHGQEAYPGTGIGLAIVRKGVERMGGKVGVTSTIGTGSEFWIELQSAEKGKPS